MEISADENLEELADKPKLQISEKENISMTFMLLHGVVNMLYIVLAVNAFAYTCWQINLTNTIYRNNSMKSIYNINLVPILNNPLFQNFIGI